MLPVGEYLILLRQVRATGIDKVDTRKVVLLRDLLRAEVLLHRHRIIGATLHRRIVADDEHLLPGHPPDPGDQPGAGGGVVVHAMRGGRPDLQKRGAGIQQIRDSLPRGHLAARHMAGTRLLAASGSGQRSCLRRRFQQRQVGGPVGAEAFGGGQCRRDEFHGALLRP